MKQSLLFALAAALLSSAQKQSVPPRIESYKSPDGMLVAVVRSTTAPAATEESRVELRTSDGKVLAGRDYTSQDGEHGYGFSSAAWTPDSGFFVYSLESSGGHQAWHTPIWFFSRADNKIFSLDDALSDAVASPHFRVSTPDRVTVKLYFSKQTRTVALHRLMR